MTTSHKCEAILKKIIEEVNKGHWKESCTEEYYVKFMSDIGRNNSVCIFYDLEDSDENRDCRGHSHFGGFSHSWSQLVDEMYKFFCKDN